MSYDEFAAVYDKLTSNIDYKVCAQYIADILYENGLKDGILLDLACGTGSLCIEIQKHDFTVFGVDESCEMLSAARRKVDDEEICDVFLICQKMEDLNLACKVDAVICMLDSLNHLESIDAVNAVFEKAAFHLNSGGLFIFDVNTPYKHENILGDYSFVMEYDDVYCIWQNEYCRDDDHRVDICLDFFIKDAKTNNYKRSSQNITERAYEISELENALKQCGFDVVNIFDDMTKNTIKKDTQRAVFVTRKGTNG
jgi:ubiquinone/menaquinone biosynthesis C-methylase UbiE